MPGRRHVIVRPASTNGSRKEAARVTSSTRKIASTAKPATSRTRTKTSTGSRLKAAAGRTIRICDWKCAAAAFARWTISKTAAILPPLRPRKSTVLAGAGQKVHCRPNGAGRPIPEFPDGVIVKNSLLSGHVSWQQAAIVGVAVTLSLPSALAAQSPSPQELSHFTTAGSYLAARHAGAERDPAPRQRITSMS